MVLLLLLLVVLPRRELDRALGLNVREICRWAPDDGELNNISRTFDESISLHVCKSTGWLVSYGHDLVSRSEMAISRTAWLDLFHAELRGEISATLKSEPP